MTGLPASGWVARFAPLIHPGEVLDLACGNGRHARLLAALGLQVTALDRNPDALANAAGPGITTLQLDLEAEGAVWPFGAGCFSAVVVTNYLHRPLFAELVASLRPDGILIYETFAQGNELYGNRRIPISCWRPANCWRWRSRATCKCWPTRTATSSVPIRRKYSACARPVRPT